LGDGLQDIPEFLDARVGAQPPLSEQPGEQLRADFDTQPPAQPTQQPPAQPAAQPPTEQPKLQPHQSRWAWVEVDKEAIRQNLKTMRKHLGPEPMILAVVKADGYGHGAIEVAKTALQAGAKCIGVANVAEGVELRLAGIKAPILILSEPPAEAIAAIIHNKLIPAVYTAEFALALGEAADAAGCVAPYHLKVDSGMNRIGVHYSDAGDFVRSLDFHRGLQLHGTFTHFATADTPDSLSFQMQLERFEKALETIRFMGMDPGIVHAANSAAAIRFKQTHYNMVRLGISMYGLHPSDLTKNIVKLRPAMSVHTRVNSIKPVPLGEGVSYGLRYRSPGGVLIATIPIGYGDGLSRTLSNKIDVLVDGHAYPQVGTICMDMCMFEITQRPNIRDLRNAQISANRSPVEYGSEAIIVGRSGDLEITLDEIAAKQGTINYDLACLFGLRLERIYLD
jgi:alanine racemase